MKKFFAHVFFAVLFLGSYAQTSEKIVFKFGPGVLYKDDGSMVMLGVENELIFRFNNTFSAAASVDYGRSNEGFDLYGSLLRANLNVFLSPTKKDKPNHFKFGTGVSMMKSHRFFITSEQYMNGELIDRDYGYDDVKNVGVNFVIENEYAIKDRFLLGAKFTVSLYKELAGVYGSYLKFGWKF